MMPDELSDRTTRLLIVDGHAYAYRAFHAIPRLNSPTGEPTHAIYGFIKMLGKLKAFLNPSHGIVVWDGGLAAERMAVLPEYKAQRPPMPESLEVQIQGIQDYLRAAQWASFQQTGVEADDWIASLARVVVPLVDQVVIASSDKDFMQLVSPKVGLVNPHDKIPVIWTAAAVQTRTGVNPEQVVDWLSLIGDNVDNIPGVPGIGPKNAAKLLQQFGSCSQLLDRLAEVKPEAVQAHLRAAADVLRRNQELIRLNAHLPVPIDLGELTLKKGDLHQLRVLFARWGFHTLLKELESTAPQQAQLL